MWECKNKDSDWDNLGHSVEYVDLQPGYLCVYVHFDTEQVWIRMSRQGCPSSHSSKATS